MPDGLRLALTTLTVLPVRGPRALDRRTAGQAMALAPLVGLLVGGAAAAVLAGLRAVTEGDLLPAVAAVAVLAGLTRGLHLDGLADTADGLASYLPADRAREVMKAPDVGALGMVTVVLSLALQAAALAGAGSRGAAAVLLAAGAGRVAVCAACTPAFPAAAPGGLGALVAGTVRPVVPLLWVLVAVAGALALDGPRGAAAVLAGLAVAALLLRHCVRRLGGVTGDVLGALVEVATTATLIVLALDR
ncbi:MAG TPA: adenosylcobinamide-GDP ribazoletransferase [Mycobacteriales bacterium]|nr:adenosylcobinamide-GDP ribazoletransferase [Mycobacteriales bacterium]